MHVKNVGTCGYVDIHLLSLSFCVDSIEITPVRGYYNIIIHVPLLILLPPGESVKTTNELHSSSLFILCRTLRKIGWHDGERTAGTVLAMATRFMLM